MELHRLLRFIEHSIPIILFGISGYSLCTVRDKDEIMDTRYNDLLDRQVLSIGLGLLDINNPAKKALYITIEA